MAYVDFLSVIHKSTKRDYLARVNDPEFPKAKAAALAKQWAFDYWDGDRRINYGGYRYDGRWAKVAKAMADHYGLKAGDKILDVGSDYAITNAKDEVKDCVQVGTAAALPFPDKSFDLVVSINALHNLHCYDLDKALREIERVGRNHKYICVESYRNEEEKANLLYWQVTCEAFNTPTEWEWWFRNCGYTGDYSFIYFE
jgi:SAM-dependent methyltransferase